MPSPFRSPATGQPAFANVIVSPRVNGPIALPVPRRIAKPVGVFTARSGLPSPLKSPVTPHPVVPASVIHSPSSNSPLLSLSKTETTLATHRYDICPPVVSQVCQEHFPRS
jgi:hypothetical protein